MRVLPWRSWARIFQICKPVAFHPENNRSRRGHMSKPAQGRDHPDRRYHAVGKLSLFSCIDQIESVHYSLKATFPQCVSEAVIAKPVHSRIFCIVCQLWPVRQGEMFAV